MEDTKLFLGPESPADHDRSQGAKNPRNEDDQDDVEIIDLGTLVSDTSDNQTSGQPEGETTMMDDTDEVSVNEAGGPSADDTARTESAQDKSGPSKDETFQKRPRWKTRKKYKRKAKTNCINKEKTTLLEKTGQLEPFTNLPKNRYSKSLLDKCRFNLTRRRQLLAKLNDPLVAIGFNIAGDKFGKFSEDEYDILITKITARIEEFSSNPPKNSFTPRFRSVTQIQSIPVFHCEDVDTKNWLLSLQLSDMWKLSRVIIIDQAICAKYFTCKAFFPGPPLKSDSEIKALLRTQNKGINTDMWQLKERKEINKGVQWKVSVDEPSLTYLRSVDNKPYYGVHRASFSILSPGTFQGSVKTAVLNNRPIPGLLSQKAPPYRLPRVPPKSPQRVWNDSVSFSQSNSSIGSITSAIPSLLSNFQIQPAAFRNDTQLGRDTFRFQRPQDSRADPNRYTRQPGKSRSRGANAGGQKSQQQGQARSSSQSKSYSFWGKI